MVKEAERVCLRIKIGKSVSWDEWWWTEEVQDIVRMKREAWRDLELQPSDQAEEGYKQAMTAAKWAVKQAYERTSYDLHEELET